VCYFTDVDAINAGDATVYAAPMSHGAGLYAVPHVMAGARHVVPLSGGFDPGELCALAGSVGRLSLFAAPTMARRLVDHAEAHGLDGEGFKTIVYGGAPMYASDIERALHVFGRRFVQIYGQGESPMTISALSRHHLGDATHPRHAQRVASVGVAHTAVQVRIADAQDRPLPAGQAGEVLRHPAVAEVSVVGAPDPEWGEVVVAFVVPHAGSVIDIEALDAVCLSQIARFKRPKRYEIVEALPTSHYGKVLKTELRNGLCGGGA